MIKTIKGDNCYEKIEQETEDHKYRGEITILNRRVRVGLTFEVTLEQRLWKKVKDKARKILTGEHSRKREQNCKSPEEGHAWIVQGHKEFRMSIKE